jgi:hypothetical protein
VSPHLDASLAAVLGVQIFTARAAAAAWARSQVPASPVPRCLVVGDAGNLTLESSV